MRLVKQMQICPLMFDDEFANNITTMLKLFVLVMELLMEHGTERKNVAKIWKW
tara:strand:- start:293 stop:451 length:159 start_codon:yes stop_codon:yes gene_type:complete